MANRIGTFPTFANLSPPWSLPTLDSNFVSVNTAINDSSLGFVNGILTDTGTTNAYQVTCPFGAPTAYNAGMTIAFVPANNNTGGSTIQVLPLSGTVSITDQSGNALKANALIANQVAFLVLVGTVFRLINTVAPTFTNSYTLLATGTTVINLGGYTQVGITVDATGAPASGTFTLTLNNVVFGAHIDILYLVRGSGQTFKHSSACTDQSGNTIPNITGWDASNAPGGTSFNLISAGISIGGLGIIILEGTVSFATQGAGTSSIRYIVGY